MLIDEALDLTLRDVLRFVQPGRTGRDAVDVETLVIGLRKLERVLDAQAAKREAKERAWLADLMVEACDRALAKAAEKEDDGS